MNERAFNPERFGGTWLCEHGNDRSVCEACTGEKQSNAELAAELLKKYERKGERRKVSDEASPIMLEELVNAADPNRLEGFLDAVKDPLVQVSEPLTRLRDAMGVERRASIIRIKGGENTRSTERPDPDVLLDALTQLDASDREEIAKVLKRLAA